MFSFDRYTYVSVSFHPGGKVYAYRTDDKTIQAGDLVIVPVTGEEKTATVTAVNKYKKKDVPFPLEKTKFIIRKASKADNIEKSFQDMRVPIDISAQSVGTKDGYKVIVLNQEQRNELRKQLAGKTNMKIIETYPVSMAGQVVKEGYKPGK